jgi:hypothetical protein
MGLVLLYHQIIVKANGISVLLRDSMLAEIKAIPLYQAAENTVG